MDDQAHKLSALGLRVARIHSGLDRETARAACRDYLSGELDFLFIAPERMRVPGFPEMLAKRKPALIAVDEAHCISQWGHDFRPDYRTVGQHLAALRPSPIIALTATATPTVQRDIVRQLALDDAAIFITGFRRSNLAVEVLELSKPQRPEFTEKLLSEPSSRPAIVYAPSRKSAEELATRLNAKFRSAAYHAGLDPATRDRVQRDFLAGKLEVVVATIAFGMGIDKADVRTVVHVALPGSVEAFYQEIGRAGRDGNASRSILLYSFADRKTQEFLLERNYPPASDLQRILRALDEEFVSPDYLQRKLKLDQETLDRSLEKLITHGAAISDFNGNVRIADEPQWQDGYDAQVAARRRQIDSMMAFAEGTTCRMTALVEHFGDRSDPLRSCGLCDICQPSAATGSAMRQPDASERDDLRAILTAVASRGTSTGKLFTDLALTKDRKHFDSMLDSLARAGLLTLTNDTFRTPEGRDVTYRKVSITHEGRTPDDETLSTVWLRDTSSTTTSKRTSKRSNKRDSKRRTTPAPEPTRRARETQPQLNPTREARHQHRLANRHRRSPQSNPPSSTPHNPRSTPACAPGARNRPTPRVFPPSSSSATPSSATSSSPHPHHSPISARSAVSAPTSSTASAPRSSSSAEARDQRTENKTDLASLISVLSSLISFRVRGLTPYGYHFLRRRHHGCRQRHTPQVAPPQGPPRGRRSRSSPARHRRRKDHRSC